MRLSDLIKKGADGDPPKKKPAEAEAKKPAPPKEEEGAFRLSGLGGFGPAAKPPAAREEAPLEFPGTSPEEETAIDLPELPGLPGLPNTATASPARAPEEETPLSIPDMPGAPGESEADPPVEEKPRVRTSVLSGPEPGKEGPGDGYSSSPADRITAENNPYRILRQRAMDLIAKILKATATGEAFGLESAEEWVVDVIETPEGLDQLYGLAVSTKDESNSMAIHLFNHSIYSLKLGRGLRWSPDRMIRLGVAALIHDIGMGKVPQHIRHKEGKLSSQELAEIQNHPTYGAKLILDTFGEPFRWLAEALYHEHEREDGRGYPQGLTGNQISEYGKVIGLADVYEALTHNRPQRKRLLPHKAVQEIIQTQKTSFHQRLLKIMLEELSVFTLNSLIRLNSNAIGRVAQTVPGQPLRPVVQIIFDAEGNEIMEERNIALKDYPLLYIVDSVDESELPRY
ncbi:MAG: HD domain-containing protein [bacterium]|nr:HD domain-containing protein [bacterium]